MAKAKEMMEDVDNVGIMQGFLDEIENDMKEERDGEEENSAAKMLDRRPDSPEILMNTLRGDMRSVDARREELADLVGYAAASETPDSVLAMLQPVLAQQNGLGALPQSMPMAQGPQAPMMPPMAPPAAGAPPMGGLPPPDMAALLAGAGGPPAPMPPPGPMMGPDGMPIPPEGMPPIQMNKGGIVQRFKDGSDEEAVTPANENASSAELMYSPEMVQMAQMAALQSLLAPEQKVPTVQEAMAARLPEYERLLGIDPESSKAGFYFDLAQAGLNLAANRGPRGERLSGSGLSRFAGAFSGIPAAMQKRVGEIDTAQRQLKLLALQAGEKDRDQIQELNKRLSTEKRSVLNTILTADARLRASQARGAGSLFGKSDWEMKVFNDTGLVQRFAAGASTPEETNLMASAITSYTEPRYQPILDPDSKLPTGQYETLPGKRLPQFILDAQKLRREGAPPEAAAALAPAPPTTDQGAVTPAPAEVVEAPAPLLSEGATQPTEAGTAQPTDRAVDEPAFLSAEVALAEPVNLWRDRAKIAGPFASIYATISATPGLGDPAREITLARSQAEAIAKEANEAFLKSAQNSVTEQQMINQILKLKPAALRDPETYGTQLIGLATIVDQLIEENQKKADVSPAGIGSTLTPDQRTEAREKVSFLTRLRNNLGLPPAVFSEEEIARLPPDVTEVLWMGITPARVRGR